MFPENYILYLQLILFYFITPGPPRVIIVTNTINYGLKKSVWTALGDISANFVQASLTTFVIGSLLIDNPDIYVFFKSIVDCVCYYYDSRWAWCDKKKQ